MNPNFENPPVIMVTSTIMDGTVVRWYRSVHAAELHHPAVSASHRGVAIHEEFLTGIPSSWVEGAEQAFHALSANTRVDLSHLATHRHRQFLNGPIEEVPRA